MTRKLWAGLLTVLCLLGGLSSSAQAGDPLPTIPADAQTPWVWVVPRVELGGSFDWQLSAYFAGLGSLDLDCVLLDREGRIVASGGWELVAGLPTDYRLAGLGEVPRGEPLSLLVSGLELGPSWLALSLWRSSPTTPSEEIQGDWIRSDPSWLSGVRTEP